MTSVLGHLNGSDFEPEYKSWKSCPPERLFEARIIETVDSVYALISNRYLCELTVL